MAKFLKALILIVIFLVGVALIVLPFIYDMPDRTRSADEMMEAFSKIVTKEHHADLQRDVETLTVMAQDTEKLLPALASQLGMTDQEFSAMLAKDYPGLAAGLDRMGEMLDRLSTDTRTIGQQVANFAEADRLPIKWTPWIFVILGVVIVVLLLLRLALTPLRKKDKEEPPAPTAPTPPTG
jgi:hypothetical protein